MYCLKPTLSFLLAIRCFSVCPYFSGLARRSWCFFTSVHGKHLCAIALDSLRAWGQYYPPACFLLPRAILHCSLSILSRTPVFWLFWIKLKMYSCWSPPPILLKFITQIFCLYPLHLTSSVLTTQFYFISTPYLLQCRPPYKKHYLGLRLKTLSRATA